MGRRRGRDADIVVLAIPLHRFATFDPALVAGKLVVDTMNYWPPIDGVQEMFEDRRYGSSEIVAAPAGPVDRRQDVQPHRLPRARRANAGPPGSPDRRALGVAGDDPAAVRRRGRRSSSASATTRSGWTASAPAASSSPAARCSAPR